MMMALLGGTTATPLDPFRSFSLRSSPTNTRAPPPVLHLFRCASSRSPPTRLLSLQAAPCSRRRLLAYACFSGREESGLNGESGPTLSAFSSKEARFDLKLPRRKLIVQFTCNSCGERTKRIINRLAYEKGTVFVQKLVSVHCSVNNEKIIVDDLGRKGPYLAAVGISTYNGFGKTQG